MADWRNEYTPEEIDFLVHVGLLTFEAWCGLFEVVGEIRFMPRPYDVEREEQDYQ